MHRTTQIVSFDASNRPIASGSKQPTGRFQLDYATWWARLAAPGSRFEPAQPESSRVRHLVALPHLEVRDEAERRTA